MKTYSRPSVVVEYLDLDGEYAGGCVTVDTGNAKGMAELAAANCEEAILICGGDSTLLDMNTVVYGGYTIQEVINYNTTDGITDASSLMGLYGSDSATFKSLFDGFFANKVYDTGADNPTSGFCYFTYTAAKGGTFS